MVVEHFVELFIESAPWLLMGLLIAGFMKVLVPQSFLTKHLGAPGWASSIKAALLGAPLPLCSCGVIPAAMGLRRSGASKGATSAFLISTPETGVDSIAISYALLGPFMAIIRPIAAISSAITAGLWIGSDEGINTTTQTQPQAKSSSCCSSESQSEPVSAGLDHNTGVSHSHTESNCCNDSEPVRESVGWAKLAEGLRFSLVDLVRDISLWLLLGLFFAALMKTYIPNEFLVQWGNGFAAFAVMALIGVPMYICATASTPIAAGFLFSGVSPGAVLVFMLVGPATNIATVGLVKRELGRRALLIYLASVVGIGFVFGAITNWFFEAYPLQLATTASHEHGAVFSIWQDGLSVILALLIAASLFKRFRSNRS